MTKLDTIAEADDARAQYDKFKADDAKSAAIAQVKKMLAPNGMQNFIDPKDGIVKWQEQMQGDSGGAGSVREFPFDWYKKGQNSDFFNILKTAGLEIVPVDRKMLFGTSQVAGIKGGPQALTDLDKPVVKPPEGGGGGKPTDPKGDPSEDIAKLNALVGQLDKLLATPTKESLDIAQQLAESFGYTVEGLDEEMINGQWYPAGTSAKMGLKSVTGDIPVPSDFGKPPVDSMGNPKTLPGMDHTINPAAPAAGKEVAGAEKVVAQTKVADNLAAKGIKAVAPEAAKMALLKSGGKLISKVLPGVGLVVGTMDAIDRAKKGDYVGAGMAGLSAVLSLGGPLTAAASMGLDAANMARDYKATGDAFGGAPDMNNPASATDSSGKPAMKPGGDPKLAQLQKIIGAKQDGFFGPETQGKLQAWQQTQGIKADGQPGPETYGKAGIKESVQTVAEGIRDLQARLELIESKHAIKESLGTEYFIDDEFMILDEHGEYVTDLLTIAVINESAEQGTVVVNELNPLQYLGKGYEALKGLGGAVGTAARASKAPDAAEKLAATGKNLTGLQKGALKTGAAVGRNPVKAALGATALGAGAGLALGGSDGKPVTPDVVTPPTNIVKPPPGPSPAPGPDNSADIADLLKQIHELMGHDWSDDQGWIAATSHAQAVVDKAEHASAAQTAMDQSHDAPTGAASPAGTTTATQQAVPGVKAGGQVVDTRGGIGGKDEMEESADELARWLRIARG